MREGAVGKIKGSDQVIGQTMHIQRNRSRIGDVIGEIEGTAEVRWEVARLVEVCHSDEEDTSMKVDPVKCIDVYVLDIAATFRVRLDEESVAGTGPNHLIRIGIDILDTTRKFATQSDRAPGTLEYIIPDHNVLGRHVDTATIAIASRLDCNIIVASLERAILDHHMITALRITAIGIRNRDAGGHCIDRYMCAQGRMQLPELGMTQCHAMDEHFGTAIRFDKCGA